VLGDEPLSPRLIVVMVARRFSASGAGRPTTSAIRPSPQANWSSGCGPPGSNSMSSPAAVAPLHACCAGAARRSARRSLDARRSPPSRRWRAGRRIPARAGKGTLGRRAGDDVGDVAEVDEALGLRGDVHWRGRLARTRSVRAHARHASSGWGPGQERRPVAHAVLCGAGQRLTRGAVAMEEAVYSVATGELAQRRKGSRLRPMMRFRHSAGLR
jgi:hypothetical protein